jgi:hypothetical protein
LLGLGSSSATADARMHACNEVIILARPLLVNLGRLFTGWRFNDSAAQRRWRSPVGDPSASEAAEPKRRINSPERASPHCFSDLNR